MRSILRRLKNAFPDRNPLRLGWHALKAFAAAVRYGFPARSLVIIGVTGTDGKTTTVSMTTQMLRAHGIKVGAASTSFFQILDVIEENPTHKTSLSPFAMQAFLRRCVNAGCTAAVIEASSHGLVQHRLDHLRPTIAAITNTSPEHLDYHGTMEQYRKDKGILFRMLKGRGTKVLNRRDDTYGLYQHIPSDHVIAYGAEPSGLDTDEQTFWLTDRGSTPHGMTATLHSNTDKAVFPLRLMIPGAFNLENALCALSCAYAMGVPLHTCMDVLSSFGGVPGRMERIEEGQPFHVFVDFTVTPKAYEETLAAARAIVGASGRLLVLTGSCGNRMREKRPMIGKIVSEGAEVMVVTEDETITEDPLTIIDDVWAGVDQTRTEAHKIPNRREAIAFLFQAARPGDAVLLCGMGACSTMQTLEGLRVWDEREVARELLKKIHAL